MPLRALYGVAGLTLGQLAEYVTSVSGGCFVVIKGKVQKIGESKDLACVIFLGVDQFLKHSARIKKNYMALVIDAPERLQTVKGLLSLGYTLLRSGSYAYTSLGKKEILDCVVDALVTETEVQWSHVPVDPLRVIIQSDETDSIMNKLRTLMYAIPNKDLRSQVSSSVYQYLTGKEELPCVVRKLSKYLGPATTDKFKGMLASSQGVTLRSAYTRYKAKPSSAEAICKAHKVSMFTLRYLEAKTKESTSR